MSSMVDWRAASSCSLWSAAAFSLCSLRRASSSVASCYASRAALCFSSSRSNFLYLLILLVALLPVREVASLARTVPALELVSALSRCFPFYSVAKLGFFMLTKEGPRRSPSVCSLYVGLFEPFNLAIFSLSLSSGVVLFFWSQDELF